MYKDNFVGEYCEFFDKIKGKYLVGEEQMPCKEIFPNIRKLVSFILKFVFFDSFKGLYLGIENYLVIADRLRINMMHYLLSGTKAVYRGDNVCPTPPVSPFKGILMMRCLAKDPTFRQHSIFKYNLD